MKKAVGSGSFDPAVFLSEAGNGRCIVSLRAKEAFFTQGDASDCVFYLQFGRARLTVVSKSGKEATITMLAPGEFIGEEAIAGAGGQRLATATAVTPCVALRIEWAEMVRVVHEEHAFSDLFLRFLLAPVSAPRPISSTSSSIRARSGWHASCY